MDFAALQNKKVVKTKEKRKVFGCNKKKTDGCRCFMLFQKELREHSTA